MSNYDIMVDPKKQKLIDRLEADKRRLEEQIRRVDRKIVVTLAGQSPIKPGDVIEWESGKTVRRGKVLSVQFRWRTDFEYRCTVLRRKDGRVIGYANVTSDRCPTIVHKGPGTPQ